MTVTEVAERIEGRIVVGAAEAMQREIRGGYASDLLSDVMANSQEGDLWVTMQKHVNIVAVAQLNGLAGIVLVNGREPEEAAAKKAEDEHIPIISTPWQAFDVAGELFSLGIRGRRSA
jgi:predicted transcriptional regulator